MDSPKIHVILDSNIFYKDLWRKGFYFKILTKLCKEKKLLLHLPFIVEQEVVAEEKSRYRDLSISLKSSIKKIPAHVLNDIVDFDFAETKEKVEVLANTQTCNSMFFKWLIDIGAVKYPLDMQQTDLAIKAYFEGEAPLTSPKIREDIPDSFIFQSIKTIHKNIPEVYFVINDNKLRKAVSSALDPKKCYSDLKKFLDDKFASKCDEEKLLTKLITSLKSYKYELTQGLNSRLYEEFDYREIDDDPPGGESGNSIISGIYDVDEEKVQFQFSESVYYGDDQILIPFIIEKLEVNITYYIFKMDYWAMDDPRPYVSDHNKHYFEAESEFAIRVDGVLAVSVDSEVFSEIDAPDFDEIVMDTTIGEISSIKLLCNCDEM